MSDHSLPPLVSLAAHKLQTAFTTGKLLVPTDFPPEFTQQRNADDALGAGFRLQQLVVRLIECRSRQVSS